MITENILKEIALLMFKEGMMQQKYPDKDRTVKELFDIFFEYYSYNVRHLTKRAADSPKAGGKSAKRKVVKAKVIRPAKSG